VIRPVAVSESIDRFFARTPTLPPATHTESYALGSREVLLVEPATPYDDERRDWLEWARGLAGRGRSIVAIVATHHHPDHVGGAEFLARELDVPLWAHARARSFGIAVDRELADGDRLTLAGPSPEEWTVLHTPGHASDHICLFDPKTRTLVVGDMVASVGTILVAPGDGDMAEYLRQLERLLKLDAKLALPAHGDPIPDPPKLFRAYLVHRAMRETWIAKSVAQHPDSSLAELVKIAYADTPIDVHPIAQLSLAAHLEKLVAEGRVSMIDGLYRSLES
jgi:glyoxylase-like metal-dependent hydrolase (beta-lactamase superfamily II)